METAMEERFKAIDLMLWERDNEKERIRNALQYPHENQSDIHFFHGISGVGKSMLCEYTRRYIQSQLEPDYALVNIDMSSSMTESQIIRHLYQILSLKDELSFPRYEVASDYLYRMTNDPSYRIETPKTASRLSDFIADGAEHAGEIIMNLLFPVASFSISSYACAIAQCIITSAMQWAKTEIESQKQASELRKKQKEFEQFLERLNLLSKDEIIRNLSHYFIEDLNRSIDYLCSLTDNYYQLFITIDAYEKRCRERGFERFFTQLFESLKRTTWFLFSTENTAPVSNNPSLVVHSYPVNCFDTDNLGEYLQINGVEDKEDQDTIISSTKGHPAAVGIMLKIYNENSHNFSENAKLQGYEELFEQYFKRHLTKDEQVALTRLALFDSWDYELFEYLGLPENHRQIFASISGNTALVNRISESENGEERYALIDIVRKTLIAILESGPQEILMDAYHCKFSFERSISDKLLSQLKSNLHVDQKFSDQLRYHCEQAFYAGVRSYSSKSEFESISIWCTKTQQSLSIKGLYNLKADLIEIYLENVQARDGFHFDTDDNPKMNFRFQSTRDRIWASRFIGNGRKAIELAGQYCNNLLVKFGLNSPNIPFALYLWGLTFQDVGDYTTAKWLFEQSLAISKNSLQDPTELHSSFETVFNNVLGCLNMDLNHFNEAEIHLLEAKKTRSASDINGQKTGYSNLSKLYFRWAQEVARENPRSDLIGELLSKAEHYWSKQKELVETYGANTIIEQFSLLTRQVDLKLAKGRLSGSLGDSAFPWRKFFQLFESAERELQTSGMAAAKMILVIQHNRAIMYALQMQFEPAYDQLIKCKTAAQKIYYDSDINSSDAKNKPAIRELTENIDTVKRYIEDPLRPFDPYDFRIQF